MRCLMIDVYHISIYCGCHVLQHLPNPIQLSSTSLNVRTWILEIAFVWEVAVCMCVCVLPPGY